MDKRVALDRLERLRRERQAMLNVREQPISPTPKWNVRPAAASNGLHGSEDRGQLPAEVLGSLILWGVPVVIAGFAALLYFFWPEIPRSLP